MSNRLDCLLFTPFLIYSENSPLLTAKSSHPGPVIRVKIYYSLEEKLCYMLYYYCTTISYVILQEPRL